MSRKGINQMIKVQMSLIRQNESKMMKTQFILLTNIPES